MTASSADSAVGIGSILGQLSDEDSIRLFKIERTDSDPPFLCRLATFSLCNGSLPPYIALSYTWGPPLDGDTASAYRGASNRLLLPLIGESGSVGNITVVRNLYEALEALVSEERYIWADSICINQLDLDEKPVQVQHMGLIFSSAQLVLAWPGKLDPEGTFEAVKEIYDTLVVPTEAFHAFGRDGERLRPISATEARVHPYGEHDPVVTDKQMNLFDEFFRERNLFKRAWVFQELAGHPVPVQVTLSGRRLDLRPLMRLFSWLVVQTGSDAYRTYRERPMIRNSSGNVRIELMHVYMTRWDNTRAGTLQCAEARNSMGCSDLSGSFSDFWGTVKLVLQYNSGSLATDPRDFLFSIAHLVNKGSTGEIALIPDYRRDASELWREVSSNMIQYVPLPAYFENLPSRRVNKDGPTWALDLSRFNRRVMLAEMHATYRAAARRRDRAARLECSPAELCRFCLSVKCQEYFSVQRDKEPKKHRATAQAERQSLVHVSWPFVNLTGCRCDTVRDAQHLSIQDEISGKASPERYYSVVRFMLKVFHEWFAKGRDASLALMHAMGRDMSSYNMEGADRENSIPDFVRVMWSDMHDLADMVRYFRKRHETHWSEQLLDDCLHHLDALDGVKGWPRRHDFVGDKEENEAHILELISGTSANMRGNLSLNFEFALFTTEAGFLGIGPNSLWEGDEVWLLNCIEERPAVLRCVRDGDNKFEVVGNVYVYQAMDGEYFEQGLAKESEKVCLV